MVYRAIGLMSGSSLDGLDIAFVEFNENAGNWSYEILNAICSPYDEVWKEKLKNATTLSAKEYLLLHADYGHYVGQTVKKFIDSNKIDYQVSLIASHGHTTFHLPEKKMTAQLGDGAAIAAETGLAVVSDLRALDLALGGQGAPIVPIGESMLLGDYEYFLNLGGIANISLKSDRYIAFDVCPANRVLNMLSNEAGKEFDQNGKLASAGQINTELLEKLNALDYYKKPFPKSLANEFGTDVVYPMIRDTRCEIQDGLRTYVEHIAIQIKKAIANTKNSKLQAAGYKLLATGGGALNHFLVERIRANLQELNIELIIPDEKMVNFKEALVMAFIGVLRWRQENNVLSSVTGALRDSIGGAVWTGHEE